MNNFNVLAAFVVCSVVAACAVPAPLVVGYGFEEMSGNEISTTLVGNSLNGSDKDGDYVIYYPTQTEMRISYQGRTDVGVWRIKKDKYCRRWTHFGKGKERCVSFYRNGDQINWVRKNKVTDRSFLVPGNPAAL